VHPESASRQPETSRTCRVVAAIPVRYASTRLPGKALVEIAGVPMIERVFRRVSKARGLADVIILTDDERIAGAARAFGAKVEMTPSDCASGTDRIASAAKSWEADAVLNVQGDEPLIEPAALERLAEHLAHHPEDPVATLASRAEPGDAGNPDVVKVVTDLRGYALYFSRAPIPYPRDPAAAMTKRHIGVYGYQRAALLEIAARQPTALERAESLEQLRMLESGFRIRVLTTEQAWPGVDTMDDLQRMEELLAKRPELAKI
jgi:3-deoxy-manno-octulosonate cytidylyltransferase (CMP-KDO synthetase)